jgi:hypothetical protein
MIYMTDAIKIITCTRDKNGVITETPSTEIPARIKNSNRLVMNSKGQEVVGYATIMIEKDNAVKYDDKIQIIKRWGTDIDTKDKKYIINKIDPIGGFTADLIRIEI